MSPTTRLREGLVTLLHGVNVPFDRDATYSQCNTAMEAAADAMSVRRTVVCRVEGCGGGWWGDVPDRCPRCRGRLLDLAPTHVSPLKETP